MSIIKAKYEYSFSELLVLFKQNKWYLFFVIILSILVSIAVYKTSESINKVQFNVYQYPIPKFPDYSVKKQNHELKQILKIFKKKEIFLPLEIELEEKIFSMLSNKGVELNRNYLESVINQSTREMLESLTSKSFSKFVNPYFEEHKLISTFTKSFETELISKIKDESNFLKFDKLHKPSFLTYEFIDLSSKSGANYRIKFVRANNVILRVYIESNNQNLINEMYSYIKFTLKEVQFDIENFIERKIMELEKKNYNSIFSRYVFEFYKSNKIFFVSKASNSNKIKALNQNNLKALVSFVLVFLFGIFTILIKEQYRIYNSK